MLKAISSAKMVVDKEKKISVIIPTLNEEKIIADTLRNLKCLQLSDDIIVVDGNSRDRTIEICRKFEGVRCLITDTTGRAAQMNKGAQEAKNEFLLFLHADTMLPEGTAKFIQTTFKDPKVVAGSFYLKFDAPHFIYKVLSRLSKLNCTVATFGDQTLFIRRTTFEAIGQYKEISILEDLEIQTRIRKAGSFIKLDHAVITSARRFEKNGLFFQLTLNTLILLAWYLGTPTETLRRWYCYSRNKSR